MRLQITIKNKIDDSLTFSNLLNLVDTFLILLCSNAEAEMILVVYYNRLYDKKKEMGYVHGHKFLAYTQIQSNLLCLACLFLRFLLKKN